MARNILQDAANTLPRMIMGERMSCADLETLAQRSDGTLSIDLLKREARDISGVLVPLLIVDHLADWMVHRLGKNGVDVNDLSRAHLALTLRTDMVPTVRARAILFDWSCVSEFAPRDGSPRRGEARGRTWYDRDRSMK
jgi:hypothetical protein